MSQGFTLLNAVKGIRLLENLGSGDCVESGEEKIALPGGYLQFVRTGRRYLHPEFGVESLNAFR